MDPEKKATAQTKAICANPHRKRNTGKNKAAQTAKIVLSPWLDLTKPQACCNSTI